MAGPAAGGVAAVSDRRSGPGLRRVVVGEYERAFYGDQVLSLLPLFERHGVQLWLPEAHGPVDFAEPAHRALLMLLGVQSKREVLRARSRVLAAMRAQIRDEGRFLGGRPLYGYRLADGGQHPNPMHAKWGRRLRCGLCGRRLESSWSHGRAAYRCQHGHSSAQPRGPGRLPNVYVREDQMIAVIRLLLRDDGVADRPGTAPQAPQGAGWALRRQRRVPITDELLSRYLQGFEPPSGEGEEVIVVSDR
jgi:hypothetical protein